MADKAPPAAYIQPYSNEYIDSLYKRFGLIESSGGKNTNHKMVRSGVNAGQVAGGETGILPNTLKDMVAQSKNEQLYVDPSVAELSHKNPEEVTETLNTDKDMDRRAFEVAARRMLEKTKGDEEKLALGWNTGHNRDFEHLPQAKLDKNKYVQDFKKTKSDSGYENIRSLMKQLNPEPAPAPNDYTPDAEAPVMDEDKLRALKEYRNRMP